MKGLNFSCLSKVVILTISLLSFSSTLFSQNYKINSTENTHQVSNTQKWVDKSGDLEGMSTGTFILIGVGVAAAVVAVILIANSGSAEEVDDSGEGNEGEGDTEGNSDEQLDGGTSISLLKYNLKNKHNEYIEQQIPLNVYLRMKRNNFQLSDNTYEIGIAVNF